MLTITVLNNDICRFSGSLKEQKILKNSIQIFEENCFYSDKYKKGYWDGFIRYYKNDTFRFGLLDIIIPILKMEKVDYKIEYSFEKPDFKLIKINPLLFSHQKLATKSFLKERSGIIVVPTRGGKTFIAAETIRQIKARLKEKMVVTFIVDGVDLFSQTVDELSSYLDIPIEDIGKFNDKNFYATNINVGMIQTFTSTRRGKNADKKKILNKLVRDTNYLIIDECHEYSSDLRTSFIRSFKNLTYRLALSATPFKDDIKQRFKILENFGRVVFKITRKELVEAGVLSDDKAFLIYFENDKKIYSESYRDYLIENIYNNSERNQLLVKMIEVCSKYNLKTLVLFNSKIFGKSFSELSGFTFLSGDDKSHIRIIEKNNFLKGKNDVLLASNIFKKGITLPEAQVILLADGGQESSAITQKRGRVLGTTSTKNRALLIDIMDIGTKYLSSHALNRLELYDLEFGKNKIEIYEESEFNDLEESLKEWFNV